MLGRELVDRAIADFESAPLPPRLRALLEFLRKVTLRFEEVTAADVAPLREHGFSDEALVDALYVCFLFNLYDRLADTLGWEVPSPEAFEHGAKMLRLFGYARF